MIIHIISSHQNIENNIGNLRTIIRVVKEHGHTVAFEWIEPAFKYATGKRAADSVDWNVIYDENIAAITRADVVIAEATKKSFGAGYQIAASVRFKKPTLVLRQDGIENDVMEAGADREYLKFISYCSIQELKAMVSDFINENDIPAKDLRFNFAINRRINNYLRSTSAKTGETKAEIIRRLIEREIDGTNP
jgi:hypothetical protein